MDQDLDGPESEAPMEDYLHSYGDIEVHRLMLDDRPRTLAYKKSIWEHRSLFKDKVVLDVGSGTGILSVFCAQAGAREVHAVEASTMAVLSRQVVAENKLDHVITVHHTRLEDLQLSSKVDIIVSEWMGFFLFHEGMLDTVITARDRFLKPEGILFPESADLWVAPCELPAYFEDWADVYGVNMSAIGRHDRTNKQEPVVTVVREKDVLAEGSVVKTVVLKTVTQEDVAKMNVEVVVPARRTGRYQGLCLWFVCNFPSGEDGEYVNLSTSPSEISTHWKQTAIVLPQEIQVDEGDAIAFELELLQGDVDPRKYRIVVTMLDPDTVTHPTPCECSRTKCIVIRTYLQQVEERGEDEDCLEDSD